jgi:hypothetical protein
LESHGGVSHPFSDLHDLHSSWKLNDASRVALKSSFLPDVPIPQVLSCGSTGGDVRFEGNQGRVICPTMCQKGPELTLGSGIHPLRSSVCGAAIVDKLIPVYGGELMISKVRGLPSYTGKDIAYAASLSVTDQPGDAFIMYSTDNIDQDRALPPEHKASCLDTFEKLELTKPGAFKVVHCPGDCMMEGVLGGTGVYTPMTSICRAAEHAGVVGSEGGHIVVVREHGQDMFFGSKSDSSAGASVDSPGAAASYTVHLPVPDFLSRVTKKVHTVQSALAPFQKSMSPLFAALLPPIARSSSTGKRRRNRVSSSFL